MNKFRNIVRLIFLTTICLSIIYCITKYIQNDFSSRIVETDCGTIISKSDYEVNVKHGTRTELFLNIQFKKRGFQVIKVGPVTYFKHDIGDNVCFDLDKEDAGFEQSVLVSGHLLFFILIIVLVASFIYWLFIVS